MFVSARGRISSNSPGKIQLRRIDPTKISRDFELWNVSDCQLSLLLDSYILGLGVSINERDKSKPSLLDSLLGICKSYTELEIFS
jgi:hypothetical protein